MSRGRALTLVIAALILAATATVIVIGQRRGSPPVAATSARPVRVILPGRPGESATVTGSDRVSAPGVSTYNSIDVAFTQMMVVHHQQALEMARLAPDRAGDRTLRALAARIDAAQQPEIVWLRGWLRDRGLAESAGHDHAGMAGMQTGADLAGLAAARGADFDRRFTTMMIAHHRGAIQMAGDLLGGGTDQVLRETANEMAVEQGSEIRRLQQLTR